PMSVAPLPDTADSRSPGTSNYLQEAILPGTTFRWTPSAGSTVIDVPIVVHDAPSDLPTRFLADGMDPAEIERQVREVVAMWVDAASSAGVDVQPEFAFQSRGESFEGDARSRVHLRFLSPVGGAFEGQASLLVDAQAPDQVLSAEIEIRVPVLSEAIPLAGYRALLAHEFGHAFGVISDAPASGHSPDLNDVMYPIAQWSTLSDGDRSSMIELYGSTPDLVRADQQALLHDGDIPGHTIFTCRH
ncbi:MAG: M10 family metallopeptidase domain-containing protein, partial [Planctomycetota bacterium]